MDHWGEGRMALVVWNNSPRMNLPEAFFVTIQTQSYFKNLMYVFCDECAVLTASEGG